MYLKVYSELKYLGISNVEIVAGKSRYETSLDVAEYIDANCYDGESVVVNDGLGEADAMSIAAVSGRDKTSIILSEFNNLNNNTYSSFKRKAYYVFKCLTEKWFKCKNYNSIVQLEARFLLML